jgi:BolA protein
MPGFEGAKSKMAIETEIRERLQAAFAPSRLDIVNESHRHQGHAGDDGSGESHFRVLIRAPGFAEMSRVNRHRAVQKALGDLTGRIHALALDIDG